MSCIVFGTDDGLLNKQCSIEHRDSAARATDGSFLFATQNGIAVSQPDILELNPVAPLARIEDVSIDGKQVNIPVFPTESIILNTRQLLHITFSAFSSLGTSRLQYRFRLSDVDSNWVTS